MQSKKDGSRLKVHIPATTSEAHSRLAEVEQQHRMSGWERAAIVWAHTDSSRGRSKGPNGTLEDVAEALGVSIRTVKRDREAWKWAMANVNAPDVKPDDDITLPTADYPPTEVTDGHDADARDQRGFRAIAEDPERFKAALRDHPRVASVIARNVVDTPATRVAVEAHLAEPIQPRVADPWTPPTHDHRADLVRVAGLLSGLVRAAQRGEWTPSATETMLLHSLALLLGNLRVGADSDALFSEIEQFLAEVSVR
jgi:AcrR family transcriptional regulator